ncbi:MAG: class I SAM-dependent methyltransferase [Bauldia litoralis]
MSRLDRHIRRMQAQRDCLNAARDAIAGVPGVIFELGLGNGRTYDHLRELFPDREIFVFERTVTPHHTCRPDDAHLIAGDVLETLPALCARHPGGVALVHNDLGIGIDEADAALAARLTPPIAGALAPGGMIVSQQPMADAKFRPVAVPDSVPEDRYLMFVCAADPSATAPASP